MIFYIHNIQTEDLNIMQPRRSKKREKLITMRHIIKYSQHYYTYKKSRHVSFRFGHSDAVNICIRTFPYNLKKIAETTPYLTENEFESMSEYELAYMESVYTKYGKYYIINRYSDKDIILYLLNRFFENGYTIGPGGDYECLVNNYKEILKTRGKPQLTRYEIENRLIIMNDDYVLVDFKKYKKRDLCVVLTHQFLEKIAYFITMSGHVCTWNEIYEHFKEDFNSFGVCNAYYAGGLLFSRLPGDFKYILYSEGPNTIELNLYGESCEEEICKFARSHNGVFSVSDLYDECGGIFSIEALYKALDSEKKDNGLLNLGSGNYIYFRKLFLSDEFINAFKDFIDSLLIDPLTPIHSSYIYNALLEKHPEWLKEIGPEVNNPIALYSLIKEICRSSHLYHKGFIVKPRSWEWNVFYNDADIDTLISTNVYGSRPNRDQIRTSFNSGDYVQYTLNDFADAAIDKYVLASNDLFVKKEAIGMTQETLNKIIKFLCKYIVDNDMLETETFDEYNLLPNLKFEWNKYLLIGIIKAFIPNFLDIRIAKIDETSSEYIIWKGSDFGSYFFAHM